jgi:hypothetical protein
MRKKKPPAKQTYAPAQKRPATDTPIPDDVIDSVAHLFSQIKSKLEPYAAHLRPLDRKRLNSVGIKRLGFIGSAYAFIMENPEFLPHYLTQERVREDHEYFVKVRALLDANKQTDEFLRNITVQASDMDYTNALDYYAAAREAARLSIG